MGQVGLSELVLCPTQSLKNRAGCVELSDVCPAPAQFLAAREGHSKVASVACDTSYLTFELDYDLSVDVHESSLFLGVCPVSVEQPSGFGNLAGSGTILKEGLLVAFFDSLVRCGVEVVCEGGQESLGSAILDRFNCFKEFLGWSWIRLRHRSFLPCAGMPC